MDQPKSSAGAIIITVVVTAVVIGGGMYWWQTSKTVLQQAVSTPTSQKSSFEQVAKFNCEQSGGTFSQSMCQCPKEPQVAGAPVFTYEENAGYCMDSFGIPGGEEGATAKKLQELQMLKNQ